MKTISALLFLITAFACTAFGQSPGQGKSVSLSGNSATIVFSGTPTFPYEVERSTNLNGWITLETTNVPISGLFQVVDTFSDLGGVAPKWAFYRLRTPTASNIVVSGFPTPQVAGVAGTVTLTVKDELGNVATGYRGTVHFTSSDGQAVLPADYAFVGGDAGVHAFSVTLKTAGTQSITAADTLVGTVTGTQSNIVVNPASASTLVASGFPNPRTAGVAGNVAVTAKDPFGNTATGYRGTVHLTSSDVQAVLPSNYTFVSADNGAHNLSVTLKTAGTQSITATDTVTNSITGTQSGIVVNPAAASVLVVAGFPTPQTAGVAGTVTVTAKDAFGNVATGYRGTIHFTSNDGQAVLPANYTFVAGDNGIHSSFSVTLKTAGSESVTATDTVTGSINGTQSGITVNPAGTSALVVSGFASPQTAGTAGSVTVTAKDAFGNTTPAYLGTIHFTSSDIQAVLPADYTFVSGDNGVHSSLAGTLKTAGSQSITATDTATSSIHGSQSGITVNPAPAALLVASGFPNPQVAGTAGTVTVTAKDQYGNVATGYRGTVHFTTSDGQAVLPADYTFVSGDNGSHGSSVTLKTAGTQSVTATDTVTNSITGTQSGIVVNPAPASVLAVTGFPTPQTAGVAATVTVTAKDPFGNVATGYRGTVHFTSSDVQAVLPADYAFVSGDNGVHPTFPVTLKTAGSRSITATDTVTNSITGTQSSITVNPAPATVLAVTAFPSPQAAGTAGTFTVTAKDPFGNTAASYRGTVHFTSTDPQAVLPADYTFVNGDNGVRTSFPATLKTAGSESITGTDTVTNSVTGLQSGITINPGPAIVLVASGFPNPQVAGTPGTVTVTVKDQYGNVATGYRGTVHFTTSDGQGVLPADYTFTSGDNGSHGFSVALKTAATQSITATDTVTGTITGAQSGIVVNPAPASVLLVSGFPTPQSAGQTGTLNVMAKDPYGNVATGYRGTIHFTSSDNAAQLPADYTFVAGDSGARSFMVTFNTVATESVTATDTVTATITGTQSGIDVIGGGS